MKTTTVERDPQAFAKLRELIQHIQVAMLVTVTPDGGLRSRPMMTLSLEDDGELRFITSDETRAVEDLHEEKAVAVCYADHEIGRYVSVTGQATISKDHTLLQKLWKPEFERFVPQGLDDPHLVLLRARIEYAELWDAQSGRMTRLDGGSGSRGGAHDEPMVRRSTDSKRPEGAPPTKGEPDERHTKLDVRATPASG